MAFVDDVVVVRNGRAGAWLTGDAGILGVRDVRGQAADQPGRVEAQLVTVARAPQRRDPAVDSLLARSRRARTGTVRVTMVVRTTVVVPQPAAQAANKSPDVTPAAFRIGASVTPEGVRTVRKSRLERSSAPDGSEDRSLHNRANGRLGDGCRRLYGRRHDESRAPRRVGARDARFPRAASAPRRIRDRRGRWSVRPRARR